jgi:hypothetical protein
VHVHTFPHSWPMLARLDTLFVRGKQRIRLPAQFCIGPQAPSRTADRSSGGKAHAEPKISSRRAVLVE